VRQAPEGDPLHLFETPVIAWRTEGKRLFPMTLNSETLDLTARVIVDGNAIPIHRAEYERRVIASDPRAKAELNRRAMATRAA
jgi:hypothetical protein